jgi:hypothetical protein
MPPRYPTLAQVLGNNWRYRTLAQVVLARNVVNVEDIDRFVQTVGVQEDEPIRQWLNSNLRKYLIRDYEEARQVHQTDPTSPPWLQKALDEGKEIFRVQIDKPLRDKIRHVIDYLKSEQAPAKLDALTVPEALKQSDAWTKQLTKKKVDQGEALEGEKIFKKYSDGFTWRDLTSEATLSQEGTKMGHCVGSYWRNVNSGNVQILSLRDPQNEPHVTIEVGLHGHGADTSKSVNQIKGKGNAEVVEKYHSYVKDLLLTDFKTADVDSRDLSNAGLIKLDGKVQDIEVVKNKPKLIKKVVQQMFHNLSKDGEGSEISLEGDDVWLYGTYPEEFSQKLKDLGAKVDLPSMEDFDYYSDVDDLEYLDCTQLIDSLQKDNPLTYAKIQEAVKQVERETDSSPSKGYSNGDWYKQHADELPEDLIQALRDAAHDGHQVGTEDEMYKMIVRELEGIEFPNGESTVLSDGKFYLVVPLARIFNNLSENGAGSGYHLETETPIGKDWSYDNGFDESAAIERFPERLHDTGYMVPEPEKKKVSKKVGKKRHKKPAAKPTKKAAKKKK